MRIAVVADLHANLEATRAVFNRVDALRPDMILCLGDLAGYNANPNEVIDLVREHEAEVLMGNHDAAASGLEEPWFFNARAQAAIAWQAGVLRRDHRSWLRHLPRQIKAPGFSLGVHGAVSSRDDYIMDWLDAMRQLEHLDGTDVHICFYGHSHRAAMFPEKGPSPPLPPAGVYPIPASSRCFINPGSVGQPRDGDCRAAFGVFDTEAMTFHFERVEYDIQTAARKVVEAGLPVELAVRLSAGK